MDSLVSLMRHRAEVDAQRIAYTFLSETGSVAEEIDYGELDRRARQWARYLQVHHAPGDRVLILLQPGLSFLVAFLACLYAGLVAIPAYPPSRAPRARSYQRFMAIANDSQASVALTTKAVVDARFLSADTTLSTDSIDWIDIDQIDADPDDWVNTKINPQDIAFLQYTSGSTSVPKGVMVSHGNIMHNERMIQIGFDHSQDDVIVGWLPLFHDMGLIGNLLQPLYLGAYGVLMSPAYFLSNPHKWLLAISDYRGTTSGGPNFAYKICVDRVSNEEKKQLDLSSWRTAFNGAEPVRANTIESFSDAFASCGFSKNAFFPCYGLAESTLLTTIRRQNTPLATRQFSATSLQKDQAASPMNDEDTITLVGSGQSPDSSQSIAIVSTSDFVRCADGQVGEVWIEGDSVALGYWRNEQSENFGASLADDTGVHYLRTGDLGFVSDGELFVTGRLKDLIVINGRNIYPQDIEEVVENCHPALCSGGGAAFSVNVNMSNSESQDIGEECLVIIQEIEKYQDCDLDALMEHISEMVLKNFALQSEEIVLIRRRSILKTTSGKIQRKATKYAYLKRELRTVASYKRHRSREKLGSSATMHAVDQATLNTEQNQLTLMLRSLIASRLGLSVERVDATKSPLALGLDSLMCAALRADVISTFGVEVELELFFEDLSVQELGNEIKNRLGKLDGGADVDVPIRGMSEIQPNVPLTFAQLGIWLSDQFEPGNLAFNLPFAIELEGELNIDSFRSALVEVTNRHTVFRLVFKEWSGTPTQTLADFGDVSLPLIDLSSEESQRQRDILIERCQTDALSPFDLSNGPLFRVCLFKLSPTRHVFFVNIHHIIADGWSVGLILEELSQAYSASRSSEQKVLIELPYSYLDYATWQRQRETGPDVARLLDFWKKRLTPAPARLLLSRDSSSSSVADYAGDAYLAAIPDVIARQLSAVSRRENVTPYILLLAILKVLLYRRTGEADIAVGTGTLGRNIIGSERLVGNFVNVLVMRTDCSRNPRFRDFLHRVRESSLTALAHQDLAFELLASRINAPRMSNRSPLFQVGFGTQNEPRVDIKLDGLDAKRYQLPVAPVSRYELSLWVSEYEQGMKAHWTYSTELFDESFMKSLHQDYLMLVQAVMNNLDTRLDSLRIRETKSPDVDGLKGESKSSRVPQLGLSRRRPVAITARDTDT